MSDENQTSPALPASPPEAPLPVYYVEQDLANRKYAIAHVPTRKEVDDIQRFADSLTHASNKVKTPVNQLTISLNDHAANAFSGRRQTRDESGWKEIREVTATRAFLQIPERPALDVIVGHELGHISDNDSYILSLLHATHERAWYLSLVSKVIRENPTALLSELDRAKGKDEDLQERVERFAEATRAISRYNERALQTFEPSTLGTVPPLRQSIDWSYNPQQRYQLADLVHKFYTEFQSEYDNHTACALTLTAGVDPRKGVANPALETAKEINILRNLGHDIAPWEDKTSASLKNLESFKQAIEFRQDIRGLWAAQGDPAEAAKDHADYLLNMKALVRDKTLAQLSYQRAKELSAQEFKPYAPEEKSHPPIPARVASTLAMREKLLRLRALPKRPTGEEAAQKTSLSL